MKFRLGLAVALACVVAVPTVLSARSWHTVKMHAQNGSRQSGTASIAKVGADKIRVTITLKNEPAGASEPAHIHPGSCASLNPVPKVALNPVVGGKSETVVDMPTGKAGAINVHKGTGADLKVYVSCGDMPQL
jgi:hypothetical protein